MEQNIQLSKWIRSKSWAKVDKESYGKLKFMDNLDIMLTRSQNLIQRINQLNKSKIKYPKHTLNSNWAAE